MRDHSLVVEWQKPVYTGSGPVTGYHVEYAKKGTSDWTTANEKAVSHRFFKVRAPLICYWGSYEDYRNDYLFIRHKVGKNFLATSKIIVNYRIYSTIQ